VPDDQNGQTPGIGLVRSAPSYGRRFFLGRLLTKRLNWDTIRTLATPMVGWAIRTDFHDADGFSALQRAAYTDEPGRLPPLVINAGRVLGWFSYNDSNSF